MPFHHVPTTLTEIGSKTVDGKRYYETPTGQLYPSVTTVMSLYNIDSIMEWRKRVGAEEANKIASKAARRGTNMHTVCENYLKNQHDTSKLMPNTLQLFKSIQPWIDKYIDNVHAIEAPLFSDHLEVGGRVDCIAEFDGKLAIVDYKTSSRQKDESKIQNYFMQCAAYAVMYEERTGISVPRIAIVMAVEGDEPLLFVKKRDDYIDDFISLRKEYKRRFDK
jgi:ATP-dependent exoDNAse (exonuclease V) beta subunit